MTEEITIEVIPRDKMPQRKQDEILSLCSSAYRIDFAPIIHSYGGPITHTLLRAGDKLVSHALWLPRWLQVGSGPLMRTAFIEAVATDPKHRGRGYATSVMKAIADHIQDFEISALAPSDHRFYARFGWELWMGPLFARRSSDILPSPPSEQVMILRLPKTPKLDLHAPLSIEWREGEVW